MSPEENMVFSWGSGHLSSTKQTQILETVDHTVSLEQLNNCGTRGID